MLQIPLLVAISVIVKNGLAICDNDVSSAKAGFRANK